MLLPSEQLQEHLLECNGPTWWCRCPGAGEPLPAQPFLWVVLFLYNILVAAPRE